jgi:putative oxidoreductase
MGTLKHMDIAILLVRLVIGLTIVAHGSQKLFGWFGGHGLAGTGGFFENLGYRPGKLFAFAAGASEFVSGLLIAFGFLGPVGPALLILVMVVAIGSVHIKNGLMGTGGYELNVAYIALALLLAFGGFGAYALDGHVFMAVLTGAGQTWITIGIGVLLGLVNLALRRPAPAAQ